MHLQLLSALGCVCCSHVLHLWSKLHRDCEIFRRRSCALQVVKGADVVLIIERSKTDKNDKPFEDIKILNFTFSSSAE